MPLSRKTLLQRLCCPRHGSHHAFLFIPSMFPMNSVNQHVFMKVEEDVHGSVRKQLLIHGDYNLNLISMGRGSTMACNKWDVNIRPELGKGALAPTMKPLEKPVHDERLKRESIKGQHAWVVSICCERCVHHAELLFFSPHFPAACWNPGATKHSSQGGTFFAKNIFLVNFLTGEVSVISESHINFKSYCLTQYIFVNSVNPSLNSYPKMRPNNLKAGQTLYILFRLVFNHPKPKLMINVLRLYTVRSSSHHLSAHIVKK